MATTKHKEKDEGSEGKCVRNAKELGKRNSHRIQASKIIVSLSAFFADVIFYPDKIRYQFVEYKRYKIPPQFY